MNSEHGVDVDALIKENDNLRGELQRWIESRDGVMHHVEELALEIMSLRCCGNCANYQIGEIPCIEWKHWNECCENWKFDGKKERSK